MRQNVSAPDLASLLLVGFALFALEGARTKDPDMPAVRAVRPVLLLQQRARTSGASGAISFAKYDVAATLPPPASGTRSSKSVVWPSVYALATHDADYGALLRGFAFTATPRFDGASAVPTYVVYTTNGRDNADTGGIPGATDEQQRKIIETAAEALILEETKLLRAHGVAINLEFKHDAGTHAAINPRGQLGVDLHTEALHCACFLLQALHVDLKLSGRIFGLRKMTRPRRTTPAAAGSPPESARGRRRPPAR
jgi:hypothetical protein